MSDYIEGDVRNGLGKLEEDLGEATGKAGLTARGKVDKTIGKVESVVGRAFGEPAARKVRQSADAAVDKAEDVYDQARTQLERRLSDEPYKVLAMTAAAGIVIGMLLGRRNHTIIYQPRD